MFVRCQILHLQPSLYYYNIKNYNIYIIWAMICLYCLHVAEFQDSNNSYHWEKSSAQWNWNGTWRCGWNGIWHGGDWCCHCKCPSQDPAVRSKREMSVSSCSSSTTMSAFLRIVIKLTNTIHVTVSYWWIMIEAELYKSHVETLLDFFF